MAYNEALADKVREALSELSLVEEKKMFSGVSFLVDGKMCINISHDDLMCRIDPALHETLVEKEGCRTMTMKSKEYKGYVLISEEGMRSKRDFDYWINLALDFNKNAKAAPKKKPKAKLK